MNDTYMERPTDDILMSYLSGQCSEDVLRQVNAWAASDPSCAAELNALLDTHIKIQARAVKIETEGKAWMRLQARIAADEAKGRRQQRLVMLRRIAAVFVGLLVVGGAFVAYRSWSKASEMLLAQTPVGKVSRVMLADGTSVWLNSGATLRYPATFDGKTREVKLEGEAYFEVAHDCKHPFLVDSKQLTVRVLGTKFNFSNSANGNSSVSLVEGSVEVSGKDGEGQVRIRPGQQANLNAQSHALTVTETHARLVASWHDDILPFENATIDEIAHALEYVYGMKVSVSADFDHATTYSGEIRKKSTVDSTLQALQLAIPMRYTVKGNTISIY